MKGGGSDDDNNDDNNDDEDLSWAKVLQSTLGVDDVDLLEADTMLQKTRKTKK